MSKEESHPPGSGWLEEISYKLDTDNIDNEAYLDKPENDYPLSFHWGIDKELYRSIGLPMIKDRYLEHALISILTEAVLAYEAGRSVSYSRRPSDYTGMGQYHGWKVYTYKNVLEAVGIGVEHGFLTSWIAPPGTHGKRRSTFTATPKLIASLAASWARHELKGLIRLKNAARELVPFKETDLTRKLEREMRGLNEFLTAIKIDLNSPDVVKLTNHWVINGKAYRVGSMAMYRVFNRTFKQGGRLYNNFQIIPKTHRPDLLLNGEPTVNLDVRQLHAAMLYDQLGLTPPEDAYVVDGFAPAEHQFTRDEGKLAFNVAINCGGGQRGVVAALLKKREETDKEGNPMWVRDEAETAVLVSSICAKNEPVHQFLGSGIGRDLMNRDSRFMIDIAEGCREADIPLLPIHDGMQIPARHESKVREIIEAAASKTFNNPSACVVRASGKHIPQIPSSLAPLSVSSLVAVDPEAAATEERRPEEPGKVWSIQFDFLSSLEGSEPTQEAIKAIAAYNGGIAPEPVIRVVRDLRHKTGESQEDVADEIGISRAHYVNLEMGRFGLSPKPAARLRRWIEERTNAA